MAAPMSGDWVIWDNGTTLGPQIAYLVEPDWDSIREYDKNYWLAYLGHTGELKGPLPLYGDFIVAVVPCPIGLTAPC